MVAVPTVRSTLCKLGTGFDIKHGTEGDEPAGFVWGQRLPTSLTRCRDDPQMFAHAWNVTCVIVIKSSPFCGQVSQNLLPTPALGRVKNITFTASTWRTAGAFCLPESNSEKHQDTGANRLMHLICGGSARLPEDRAGSCCRLPEIQSIRSDPPVRQPRPAANSCRNNYQGTMLAFTWPLRHHDGRQRSDSEPFFDCD